MRQPPIAAQIIQANAVGLSQKGLLQRRANAADLRCNNIVATPEVKRFLRDIWPSLGKEPRGEVPGRAIATLRRLLEHSTPTPVSDNRTDS